MTKAMKNLFKSILFIAAAAMTFSACNKTETEILQNEEDFYYTFALTSPETRALLASDENGKFGAWEDGDRLGTAIDDADPGYAYVTTTTTPVTFRIYKKGGLTGGEIVYAYYPFNSATTSISAVSMTIPVDQNQDGTTFDFDAMPMVAEGFEVPTTYASENNNTEIGEISLVNLGSVIDFQIFSSDETYAEETILSVKFAASSAIAGEFSKDITAVKFSDESTFAISGYAETEVTTTVANAPVIGATRNDAANVYMVVAPGSGVTGSVVVTTNKAIYTYDMATAQTFKRAGLKSFGLNLGTCQNRVEEETAIPITVTSTISEILARMGQSEATGGVVVNPLTVDDVITMKTTGTGNNAKVYGTSPSQDWRIYAANNGNVIISAKGGYKLQSVKLTYSKQNGPSFDGPDSGVKQAVSGASVEYHVTSAGHIRITAVEVQYVQNIVSSIAISGQKTEFFVGDDFTFGGTVTATYADGTTEDVTAAATFSEVDLSTAGTKEVTVSYGGKTATYDITVTARPTPIPDGSGTWADPYNAAAAMEIIEDLEDNETTSYMTYVTGTIVGTPSFSETFGNMQYEISSGNVELLVYRGFYFNGAKFTSADQLKEGDVVTVYGKLKKYVNGSNEMTAEIDQDNILVELNGTKHMISPTVTAEVNNDAKTIKVTWNVVDGASRYDVTCGTLSQTGLTATTYTFTVTENGTYDITVSAKADGLDTVSGTAVAIVGSADWATIYTSNVTLTTEGGTSASAAKVVIDSKEYDAIKAGTGKVAGAVKVTVPKGNTHLHIHAAGWNGENVALSISGATITPSSLTLTADSGVASNSPFTLVGDASSYYFDLEFSETDAPTTLTFTATSGKRFVIWGVNAE